MSIRLSHVATGMLVVAAMVLTSGRIWAVFYPLGPSKDEWKLKYDVEVREADGDKLTVVFTLADEGRLKPISSINLVAFSEPDRLGGRTYDVKAPFELKPIKDGRRAGQAQMRKRFVDRAKIRILTLMVDGKRQTAGAAYFDIPIAKYMKTAPAAASSAVSPLAPPPIAAPSASKVTR
jgi:hypothetical protein